VSDALTLQAPAPATAAARFCGKLWPLLLAGTFLLLALVPDEQILRSKVLWAEAALAVTAAAVLLGQAAIGRVHAAPGRVVAAVAAPLLVALAWLVVAIPLSSGFISRTLARDECERLLIGPVALWAATSAAARPEARRLVVGAILAATIPVAMYALAQHLAGLLELPLRRMERPASTFGNPAFLGAFLVLVSPVAVTATLFGRGWQRWGGALAAGFALPALYATQTRGAWIGLAAASVVGIALLSPTRASRNWLLLGLGVSAALMLTLNVDVLRRPSEHSVIWRDTLRMVAARPWGVGPGQFQPSFLPYASPELLAAYPRASVIINDAHSEPLQALAELGWAGLLAAIVALVVLGRAALAAVRSTGAEERPLAVGLLAGLGGHVVMSLGSPDLRFFATTLLFFLLAGLLLAFGSLPERTPGAAGRLGLATAGMALLVFGGWRTLERVQVRRLLAPPSLPPTTAASTDLAALRARVDARPQDPQAQFDLGVALGKDQRWAEAADAFQAAYVLGGGQLIALRDLALMQALAGRVDEALPNLRVVLAQLPDDADARYALARLEFTLGDVASATRDTELLLKGHPDHRLGRLLEERLRE
jgi:O-antigen ligase